MQVLLFEDPWFCYITVTWLHGGDLLVGDEGKVFSYVQFIYPLHSFLLYDASPL